MNLNLRRRLWCQEPVSLKMFVPPCWKWSQGENRLVHCHYGWHGEVCVATTILSYVFVWQ
jgi:hypothetical protein